MNDSACWRSKKALASIRCLTINTWVNRIVIVSSIITRIFLPYASVWWSHFNLFSKDTCDYFMLWIMLPLPVIIVYYCYYCLIYYSYFFDFCSVFHSMRLFCSIQFHCSVFMFTSKYSVLILDCIPGISIPLNIIIKQVNKHHTTDCTVFVLV